jgi:hypothetical protein
LHLNIYNSNFLNIRDGLSKAMGFGGQDCHLDMAIDIKRMYSPASPFDQHCVVPDDPQPSRREYTTTDTRRDHRENHFHHIS